MRFGHHTTGERRADQQGAAADSATARSNHAFETVWRGMPQSFSINCDDFIRSCQDALASQSWALVDPLIHNNVCVTFSNGTVHRGKPAVA